MPRLLILLAAAAAAFPAEPKFEFWPGASYDSKIPTFKQVLGYEPGERISSHAQLVRYLDALAASTPRIKVFTYGESWEGRKLVYAVVGTEANMRRLEEIRSGMQRLADPRKTSDADAKKLVASLPALVWLAYGVHGNEISSPDAALLTAYHLLASRDKATSDLLASTLVIILPSQNPDGRDRFVHQFEQSVGMEPDASPLAAEHVEPWPGGRGNHYLFDLNRDWLAFTQPEIRDQAKALLEWYPLVYVDLHEMGSESTYYFTPEAAPYNPHLTKYQRESLDWFGKNNARWFDKNGFDYFTREVFDAFYPGYGASWPEYWGCIAMTYEQASTRGLIVRRSDDSVFRFRDTVRQHFTASISTIETAAAHRADLLQGFYDYRKTAIEEGTKEPVKAYIIPRKGNLSAVDKLVAVLADQGIEIQRAAASFKVGQAVSPVQDRLKPVAPSAETEFPAGSYLVTLAQPSKRLIRVMLDPQVPMDAPFLKEQERLRRKKLPDEIYDVTAWSLPLLFNVECVAASETPKGSFERIKPERVPAGQVTGGENAIAYLVPWGNQAAGRLLAAALRKNLTILSTDKAFVQNGRKYPAGTLVFKAKANPPDLPKTLDELARTTGAEVVGTDSGWVEEGVNFGSNRMARLRKPAIAVAWDRPTSSTSAGAARFVLERQFAYPVTPIRAQMLGMADLSKFHVLVLPDAMGDYGQALGPTGARRIKQWVTDGGTLILIGGAVSWAADPRTALVAISQENAVRPGGGETPKKPDAPKPAESAKPEAGPPAAAGAAAAAGAEPRVPGKLLASEQDYLKSIQADSELPDGVAGVILKAKLDPDHWLSAGLGETVYALVNGRAIFTPIKLDKGVNAAVFAGPDQVVASGYMWEEAGKQFSYKPLVVVQRDGRGQVIAFTADPNFRASTDGMNMLFVNAVFRGPGRTRSAGEEQF